MPVTEAGYWPLLSAYRHLLYVTLCVCVRCQFICFAFNISETVYPSVGCDDAVFFLLAARFCVGLIRIRNVISRRETRTEKSDRSSSSQEAWRWRVSTWPSRREFCVRRCCCWARPTRTCVLKSKFTPESWVRRLYQWYAGDLILLCQFPLQHIIACRWPFVIFFLTVGEVKVFTPSWFSACFQCALKKLSGKTPEFQKKVQILEKQAAELEKLVDQ